MTYEHQPLLSEFLQEVHGQFSGVLDELVDVHRAGVSDRGVRFARAALIPVHDREAPLELSHAAAVQGQLRRAGATVEVEQDRVRAILRSLEHPLISSADPDAFERVDVHPLSRLRLCVV
jgi:hypothetical protein